MAQKFNFICSDHQITIEAENLEQATEKLQKVLKRTGEELYTLSDFTLEEDAVC